MTADEAYEKWAREYCAKYDYEYRPGIGIIPFMAGWEAARALLQETTHVCGPPSGCCCYVLALEPDESCPTHGHPDTNRCGECGKFIKRK